MNNKKVFEMMSHYYNDYDETIKQSGDIQQEVIDPDIQDFMDIVQKTKEDESPLVYEVYC